jgi:glycerate 2-kinase
MTWDDTTARATLRRLFETAIRAADPRAILAEHLPERPKGRVIVIGAGKSASVMAAAVEDAWPDADLSGLVVTRYGHAVPTRRIETVEASHPVPDAAGEAAARRILALMQGLTADDLVLALISGGGSALLALPDGGLTLSDKQAVNRALLASGATIQEMNCVRRHLSAIKGGRLAAAAYPARVVTLAISDVPGDEPSVIASGPTVPDPTTFAEAQAILARYEAEVPPAVAAHLADAVEETPKPGDPRLARAEFRMIATPQMALEAVASEAQAIGLPTLLLGDALEGEAAVLGTVLAGIARSVRTHGHPLPAPCLLGFAVAAAGAPGVWVLMGDTDGIDGSEDNAGAIVTPDTLARARAAGLDPRLSLSSHDSYGLFASLGDTIVTGPTLTNVNDLRLVLIA